MDTLNVWIILSGEYWDCDRILQFLPVTSSSPISSELIASLRLGLLSSRTSLR